MERKKMNMKFSNQQDKAQLDSNQVLLLRKQQEALRMKKEHEEEMDTLRENYANFQKQIDTYHTTLMDAISG